jgi:tetratricopeptide (TPR) repeat protein
MDETGRPVQDMRVLHQGRTPFWLQNLYDRADMFLRSGEWLNAVQVYEKALTFVPRILGVHEWFEHYLLAGKPAVSVADVEVANIYARMGACYCAVGQWQEAYLNLTAALKWHPASRTASALLGQHPELERILATASLEASRNANPIVMPRISHQNRADFIRRRLTLIITTHCSRKLTHFRDLAPPTVKLISATYGSMLNVFGNDLEACNKIVCYDSPLEHSRDAEVYKAALEQFCQRQGFECALFQGAGLRRILQTAVPWIATPYLMFVEHDWFFTGPALRLEMMLHYMDHHHGANMIRFNQRANVIERYDFLMAPEHSYKSLQLLKTVSHSNNPSIIRTAKLRDEWLPICLSDKYYSRRDLADTAFGVEEPLLKKHMDDVRRSGFQNAHENWGTYLYGGIGEPAHIIHLGQ